VYQVGHCLRLNDIVTKFYVLLTVHFDMIV